jgi:(E)-4-hydroxy-3-methylbut-2-enyl-diphosphate synthase
MDLTNNNTSKIVRKQTREIDVSGVKIGGNNPVVIQSMCSTKTKDIEATVSQILDLEEKGCQIIRIGVPDIEAAKCISKIVEQIHIPLVADIHYDYLIAIEAMKQGAAKIRINPGNTPKDKLKLILDEAKKRKIPIRIGINWGSLSKEIKDKYGHTTQALVESALETIELFESWDFFDIIVSLKSSDIFETIEANKLFSEKSDYPIHLGVTEAGTLKTGLIKSSVAMGHLLMQGIGDTIRISLSAEPLEEIIAAHKLLRSLGLKKGAQVISCPTCARSNIDIFKIAEEVEKEVIMINKDIKIGVMGCFVNADEAKIANLGIAGAVDGAVIFKDGEILRKVSRDEMIFELKKEIEKYNL